MKPGFIALLLLFSSSTLVFSGTPAGSLSTFGPGTQISGVRVRSGAAVFSGDRIQSDAWGALLVLSHGRTIRIGPGAEVRVASAASAEIVSGLVRVQAKSEPFMVLAADWRLQGRPDPATGVLSADVVRGVAGNVSLNVSKGQVIAEHRDGKMVVVAQAGRPAMLPAAFPQSAAGPSSPAAGGKKAAILAYLGGAAGLALGVSAAATKSDTRDLRAQVADLSSRTATLTAQANSLLATLQALKANAEVAKAFADLLTSIQAQFYAALAELAHVQEWLDALYLKMASGQPLTSADQAQFAALSAQLARLSATISSLAATLLPIVPWKPCPIVPSPAYPCLP